jgi:DNA-binding GntR family transcriptional regulator
MASSSRGAKRTNAGVPPSPKEMQDAYEIRAALEEVGGRAAARTLKGNTTTLQRELEAMRAAFDRLDLDSFVEHDIAFHRKILEASQNEVLLRAWDSLAVDLWMRALIGRISGDFPGLVESHHSMPLRKGEAERRDSCCGITSRQPWSS